MSVLNNIKFLIKSIGIFLPNSRYNRLKNYLDINYNHDRDKHPIRFKHYANEGWSDNKNDDIISYRNYENYEEYVIHQKQKITEMLKLYGGLSLKVILRQRYDFWKRFKDIKISKNSIIYCLGARFGTEVEVLRDLGYKNAIGFDLEPGPNNPFVVYGDFMKIEAENRSVDMIYCNAVDHAYDLRSFFKEHARVLKDNGICIYDICMTAPGAFEAVDWGQERNLFLLLLECYEEISEVKVDRFWKTVKLSRPLRDVL